MAHIQYRSPQMIGAEEKDGEEKRREAQMLVGDYNRPRPSPAPPRLHRPHPPN